MHDAFLYQKILAGLAQRPSGCWEWTKARREGYGAIHIAEPKDGLRRLENAHRAMFTAIHGPIPDGQVVRHQCDNRLCANPAHLILGTKADNWKDAVERNRVSVGYHPPKKILSKAEVIQILSLSDAGASTRSLSEKFDIPKTTLRRLIRSRGRNQYWESRP